MTALIRCFACKEVTFTCDVCVSEKGNRKSCFFFWEAEILSYLGNIRERLQRKVSKRRQWVYRHIRQEKYVIRIAYLLPWT